MKPFIFSINAFSGGGKTTTTKALQKRLPNAKALYFDDRNYDSDSGIHDTAKWIEEGADVNLWDLQRLAEDIEMLKKENPDFIIMDYPFGYSHQLIAPYLDYSIYIDTPLDITLARRIIRDYTKENITHIFNDMKDYLERNRTLYLSGLNNTKNTANFLVDGSLPIEKIVECISEKVINIKNAKHKDNSDILKTVVSIIPYELKYRDDMIFCFLSAKDAIGGEYAPGEWSKPIFKDELLDIEQSYIKRGDVFYLAIDERDRVVGMIGTETVSPTDLWLKRLFIKPERKGKGIGSKLLAVIERYAVEKGITTIHTRFAHWYHEAAFFYPAKGFVKMDSIEPEDYRCHMVKKL